MSEDKTYIPLYPILQALMEEEEEKNEGEKNGKKNEKNEEKEELSFLNRIKKQAKDFETKSDEKVEKLLKNIKSLIDEKSKEGFKKLVVAITLNEKYFYPYNPFFINKVPDSTLVFGENLNENHIAKLKNKLIQLGFNVNVRINIKLFQSKEPYIINSFENRESYLLPENYYLDFMMGHIIDINWSESRCLIV